MSRKVIFDFETASCTDLQKVGAWKYAADMSTFITHLSIKVIVDNRPQPTFCLLEKQLFAIDERLMELAKDPEVIFIAHNASFEAAMWHFHMVPMGYPVLPPERMHDTMAVAAMKALPLGLDALVTALELPVKKDMEGHRLMMQMCKPDRYGGWSHHNEFNLSREADYCNGDTNAQYGVYVSTQGLGADERHTWIIDQKIQQRGLKIDTDFVRACVDVLNQVRIPMTERFRELTGLKPTQREKVLNWVNEQGVPLGDVKKATLDAILDPDDEFDLGDFSEPLPIHVHEVLTLRRSLASSSVAKLERMLQCAGSDGRVRYTTQYHGARTGRDAGRLIQIQNYPRGEISDRQGLTADILADAISTRNIDHIRELWGPDIFTAVISSLRSCVVPEKGKILVAGDYSGIEARNLLSMAGQHDRAEQMHSGVDVYSENASLIFKRPITKANVFERTIGKCSTLGCLAADTLTLTHTGYKPIVEVLDTDLLWDGEAWIHHQGLVFQGYKETLNFYGLRMTPEHPVFIGDKWRRADEVTENLFRQALDFAKAHGPLSDTVTVSEEVLKGLFADAIADMGLHTLINTILCLVNQADVTFVDVKKYVRNLRTALLQKSVQMNSIAPAWLKEYMELYKDAKTLKIPDTEIMGDAEYALISKIGKPLWHISSRWKGGMTHRFKLTVSIITDITKRVIYGLLPAQKIIKIKDKCGNSKKKLNVCEPVYDLAHAGPNNRFTVMTSEGPLIVHNSGYGLGPIGFRARFAPKQSIEFAQRVIQSYREDFAEKVPRFWYGLYEASVNAVWCKHAKTYSYAGIEFRKEGDFLTMRLPSGRKIWYHRPRKERSFNPTTGNEHPSWSFMSYQGKKFRRHLAWHGMITADCIQGSARCMLVSAMKRAEKAGLFTIFKVHDELVFEETDRPDIVQVVKQVMEDVDDWVRERKFRVNAEVSKMLRYTK